MGGRGGGLPVHGNEPVAVARAFEERLSLRVVSAPDKPSAGYARNVGVRAARGGLIVFVDGDDVADAGLLSAFARHAANHRMMGGHLDNSGLNDPVVASWR